MHGSSAADRTHPDEGPPIRATKDPNPNRKVGRVAAKLGPCWGPHAMATSAVIVGANGHSRTRGVSRSECPMYDNGDMAPCDYNR